MGEGEGATQIGVTGTLSGDSPTGAVAVELSVESGPGASGAVAGEDFADVVDFTLSIPSGQTSATATFTLTPLEDRVDEPAETLVVAGATSAADVGIAGTVSIALADNDAAPELALAVDPAAVAENGGTSTVTVSTGTGSTYATAQTITLTLAGTATRGSDYTVDATTLVLPAGAGSTTAEVDTTITAVNDTAADPGETVIVSASAGGEAFGSAQTVTITDDEGTPKVRLVLTPEAVFEGGTSRVSATVSPVSSEAFDGDRERGGAKAPADGDDFTLTGTTLSFAADAARSTGLVTVEASDDNDDNDDRTVTVSGAVTAAGVTAPQDVDLTIRDDESAVTLSLGVAPDSIAEDGGMATVTVSTGTGSTPDSDQVITLVLGGTAVEGQDYAIGATTLILEAGASTVVTTVTATDDNVFEGSETLTLSALLDGVGFGTVRTVTLTDDESAPTIALVLTPESIAEDGAESSVTATLSAPSAVALEVTVEAAAVAPATADDFTLAGGTLSLGANALTSTGEVTVTAVDDPVDAPDKQVRISGTVSDPRFAAPAERFLSIEDDDEASNSVSLTVAPAEIGEGAGPTELTLTATYSAGAREQAAEFIISVLGGGGPNAAESDVDFEAVSDFPLSIAANETSGTAMFTLEPLQDIIREGPEVLSIVVASTDPDIGVTAAPSVTVTDDDGEPELELALSPAALDESGGTATVTVSTGTGSTFRSAQSITLSLAGTATLDSDYTIGATTLNLPAGSGETATSVSTTLSALDDIVDEPEETVEVTAALGATEIGTETARISDDDEAPELVLAIVPDTILEFGGTAAVTVSTAAGSTYAEERTITLSLSGTADLDQDYTISSDTLTLAAGDGLAATSVSAEIAALDDTLTEPDETVVVTGAVEGAEFGTAQTLTIADDESGTRVVLVLSPFTVSENGGSASRTRDRLAAGARGVYGHGGGRGGGAGGGRGLHPER